MKSRHVGLTLALLLASLAFAEVAEAQFETRGSIYGTVQDPDGQALPGVTLTLESEALIRSQTAVTGQGGRYRFPVLPPGEYRLTAEISGFRTVTVEGLRISGGLNVQSNLQLELATVAETITVTGQSPMVDFKDNDVATSWDARLIAEVPTSRDIGSITDTTPGVSSTRVFGTLRSENTYLFNGVDVNDPAGQGGSGIRYDIDSIEEINVVTAAKSPEVRGGGLFVQLQTKSGGNTFAGSAFFYGSVDDFTFDNIDDELAAQGVSGGSSTLHDYDGGGQLGGPIIQNRLWFFGAAHFQDQETEVIGFTLPDGTPGSDVDEFYELTGKGTAQVSEGVRVEGFVSRHRTFSPLAPATGGNFSNSTADAMWSSETTPTVLQGTLTAILSDEVFVDLRGGSSLKPFALDASEFAGPNPVRRIELSTGDITGGPDQKRHHQRNRHHVDAAVTWYQEGAAGSHEVRGGLQIDTGGQEVWQEVPSDQILYFDRGVPAFVDIWKSPTHYNDRFTDFAVHLNDAWTPSDRITINAGFRFSHWASWWPEQTNRDPSPVDFIDTSRTGIFFPGEVVLEKETVIDWTNIAPRLGVTVDPTGDGLWAIRASYGRYYNQPDSDWADVENPNLPRFTRLGWTDLNGDLLAQPDEVSAEALLAFGLACGFGLFGDSIADDIEQPVEDQYLLGVDRQLTNDMSVGVYLQVRRADRGIGFNNPLVPLSGYDPIDVPSPIGGTLTVFDLQPEFAGQQQRVMDNQETAIREYEGVELRFDKRYSNRWQLRGSLTVGEGKGIATNFFDSLWMDPNLITNKFGADRFDSKYIGRLLGTFLLPYDVQLGINYRLDSGKPFTRTARVSGLRQGSVTVNLEAPGAERLPAQHLLDFGVEKRFATGSFGELSVRLDAFNFLNANTVSGRRNFMGTISSATGAFSPTASFNRIRGVLSPRTLRLGARFRF